MNKRPSTMNMPLAVTCLNSPSEMPSVALNLVLGEARVYTGDCLNATVLLDSADPETIIHELLAEIRGVGRTGWVNIHTDKIYETEQEYINLVLPLCHQQMALRPGRHRFALRVAIPDGMPSSFESEFGSIRYTVKISLSSNADHSSAVEVFPFFVVTRSFFDDVPQAVMQPIDYRDEIDFTVCTLPFGTVYLRISLPRTAFCLGEMIPAKIYVKNATRKAVKDCRLQLLLKIQFEAKSRYEHANDRKLVEQIIDSWLMGRVKGRTEKTFDECRLRVPETATPTYQQQSVNPSLPGTSAGYDGSSSIQYDHSGMMSGGQQSHTSSIIVLSYVLRFTALPGIETEIPLVITSQPYSNGSTEPPQREEAFTQQPAHWEENGDIHQNAYSGNSTLGVPLTSAMAGSKLKSPGGTPRRVSIFETNGDGGALYFC
ncbi:arrestin domain-containing protein 15 [Ditylenchus destructor]|nr:arrestin domain-containing protein 15 [Ditylenchus destructor]